MSKYTVKNGKVVLTSEVKGKPAVYQGKRKVQGEKAAKELEAATKPASS